MKYDEGDQVLIVAGDFEGNIGMVMRYEELFDRYLINMHDITVAAKEWELEYMPEDVLDYEHDTYRFRVTVITPESFNEFITEHPSAVAITDFGMLEVNVVENGMLTRIKAFAPGQWCTVDTQLEEVV